jgi:hypothetical protein
MPPTAWNLFVKKIYHEGKAKNKNYQFKDALKDASKRKSEMGSSSKTKKSRGKSRSRNASLAGGRKSRKHRKH